MANTTRFSSDDTGSTLVAGLKRPPVRRSDVDAVRKNYDIKSDFKPKGKSDTDVYNFSRDAVIAWWKKMRNDAAKGIAPDGSTPGDFEQGGPGSSGGGGGGAGGSGGGGGARGSMLPNTAMGVGGMSTLPGIPNTLPGRTVQSTAQQAAQIQANQIAKMTPGAGPSAGVGTSQLKAALKAAGLTIGTSGVPATARLSVAALNAWIAAQRKTTVAKGKGKVSKAAPLFRNSSKPLRRY